MIEIILTVLVVTVIGYSAFKDYLASKERAKMLNAVISRNAVEFRDLELTDKVVPIQPNAQPDLINESEASDAEFDEFINKEVS